MTFGGDVDRRTFLKLGAAGAALAAVNPKALASSRSAKETLPCPPSVAAMASDRLTHRLRDLFNCPVAMNELGYTQVGKSVSAITAISFPPYACCGVPETSWSPGFLSDLRSLPKWPISRDRRAARRGYRLSVVPALRASDANRGSLAVYDPHVPAKQPPLRRAIDRSEESQRSAASFHAGLRYARRRHQENHALVREFARRS